MSVQENEAIIRRYVDELNRRSFGVLDEVVADLVSFGPDEIVSRDEYCRQIVERIERWPGYHVIIDESIATGDEVRVSWTFRGTDRETGDAVTGDNASVYVLADGRIVEVRAA